MSLRTQSYITKTLSYLGMALLVIVIGLPVFWLITGALKGNKEILTANPQFLPQTLQLDNFARAWTGAKFSNYYVNSIATTLMGTTAEVIMAITTAYALVFVRFPFRNAVFVLLLIALMVPEQVVIVPNFLTIARMGLLITKGSALDIGDFVRGWLAIFLPGASIAFGTFLLRQYFRTIPMDLTDAAKVDGASHFSTMMNVVVPVAMPAIATAGLLSFTAKWNEYLWPLIVTYSDQLRTLPIAISRLLDAEGNTEWGVVMAGALFVVVPVVIVFLFVQRFVVEGIAAGAVKG